MKRLALAFLAAPAIAGFFIAPANAAFETGDIICETTATTGTGTVNLAGAVTNYATFASQITSGAQVPYHIVSGDGKLETGIGVFTDAAPDTLSRVADWSTDGSGAELTLSGTSTVCLGPTSTMFNNGLGLSTPATSVAFALDSDGTPLTALTLSTTGMIATLNGTTYAGFDIVNTNSGAEGAYVGTYLNSASPANGDLIGFFPFYGNNTTPAKYQYGDMRVKSVTTTAGGEYGTIEFYIAVNNTYTNLFSLTGGYVGIGASILPFANTYSLGDATHLFTGTYLTEGGVINWDNGDLTLTQSGDTLTVGGGVLFGANESFIVAASDEVTNIAAGTGKVFWRNPYAFTVTAVSCSLSVAQTAGGLVTVDINEGAATAAGGTPVSILGTKITIDNSETSSNFATTPPTITDTALAANAEMSIDIDSIGTPLAKGLKCTIIGHQ